MTEDEILTAAEQILQTRAEEAMRTSKPTVLAEPQTAEFGEWCVIELFGHRRLAGYVREVTIAGDGFLRLDVPASNGTAARTQFYRPAAVYALHPVTEDTARRAAAKFSHDPVSRWELPALPAPTTRPEPGDDGYDEWAAEGMATAADPDPDYGKDLDDEDDEEGPF